MNKSDDTALLLGQLTRIADALERKHPIDMAPDALPQADAYVWQSDIRQLVAVARRAPASLDRGARDRLLRPARARGARRCDADSPGGAVCGAVTASRRCQ